MENDLVVKLRLDRAPAEASAEKFAANEKARQRDLTSSSRMAERAKASAAEAAGRERIQTANKVAQAEQKAAKETSQVQVQETAKSRDAMGRFVREGAAGLSRTAQATSTLTSGLQSIAGGAAALGIVTKAASVFVDVLKSANAEAQRQIDKLAQSKDLIREIAMIRGSIEGPSDAELTRFMNVRTASGLSANEAKENVLEFEGSAASSKGVNISDSEYERLKPMQARFAATAGGGSGAAGTFGKLSGLLLGLRKFDKAEDVVAAESQFNRILSRGVGDNPTLIKQSAQVAGAYIKENGPGIVQDERELAAMTATASRINPDTAAETMKSTTRVLRGFDEKWGPLLKETGITEKDTYTQASGKLFGHLEGVEQSGRSIDTYLAEKGVDQHGAVNLSSMYRYRNFLTDTMADESTRMTGKEAQAEIDNKYRTDVTLRQKVEEARKDEAELGNAMPRQFYKPLELEAQTNLLKRGEGPENAGVKSDDYWTGLTAAPSSILSDPEGLGRKMREEKEMFRIAQERGLEVPGRPNDTSLVGGTPFAYTNWIMSGANVDAYSSVGTEMEMSDRMGGGAKANRRVGPNVREGGDPAVPILEQLLEETKKGNAQRGAGAKPPIQAKPVVQSR